MSTARAAKRDLVISILTAGIPAVGGRVFAARVWPLKLPQLPAILVYGWKEDKTLLNASAGSHSFEVGCDMVVEARVAGRNGPDVESALEDMAGQIEEAIITSAALAGQQGAVARIAAVRTQLAVDANADMITGTAGMSFRLEWYEEHEVASPVPDAAASFGFEPVGVAS